MLTPVLCAEQVAAAVWRWWKPITCTRWRGGVGNLPTRINFHALRENLDARKRVPPNNLLPRVQFYTSLGARVRFRVSPLQALGRDMGVDLCRRKTGVA